MTKIVRMRSERAESIEPESLKFEHDRVKKIAENDTGGERRYC